MNALGIISGSACRFDRQSHSIELSKDHGLNKVGRC